MQVVGSVVKMPYSKDIRAGSGWFNYNVNVFFDYLDSMSEEIILLRKGFSEEEIHHHNKLLEEEIENRVNQYIAWKVFGIISEELHSDSPDSPEFFEPKSNCDINTGVCGFVYHHVCKFLRANPSWYELRATD